MTLREFFRYHLLKVLLILVVVQLGVVAFVQNYNHHPSAQTDRTEVFSRHEVSVSPLANDSDKDEEDEISLQQINSPLNGSAVKRGNTIRYTPNNDFVGIDSFAYTITDGDKESKPAYIVVEVKENLAPTIGSDSVLLYSGSILKLNVLGNDTDREGDSLFIEEFGQPDHGSLSQVENILLYKSEPSFTGTDSFVYSVSDGVRISEKSVVTIKVKSRNDVCFPWLSSDIGNVAILGSLICNSNKLEIKASGDDIWNQQDAFHFAYQYIKGNCEIVAKVESLEGTHEWAKAGLMIRESLTGGSKDAFVLVSGGNGITYHHRLQTNNSKQGGDKLPDIKAPYWLKLKRTGNTINYYASANGTNWQELSNVEVTMSEDVFIGLAVTSHNNKETAKAIFSNIRIRN